MKTQLIKLFLLSLVNSIFLIGYSQADSSKTKVNFKLGTYYNSRLNYYGRTDSLQSSGIFPMAELWLNNKFYINAAPVFTYSNQPGLQYAGTVATAGYLFNNGKYATHIYAVKPFYVNNSQLVQSALKAQTAASFTWLNKILNITAGADVKFSNNIDLGATAGLDHIIRKKLPGNAMLIIDPSFYVYAGTQRFTESYYKKTNFLLFPGSEQLVQDYVKKFSILSYEFSAPLIYAKGKWMLMATPAYVIPQNLVTVENRSDLSERGEKMFYMTAGVKVSL